VSENNFNPEVFDPYCIPILEKGAAGEADAYTVRASRLIVLTQAGKTPLGMAVPVTETQDLTVYGNVVRVSGVIRVPGRTVKIVCRRLEFHPGPDGKSGINVNGTDGAAGLPVPALAAKKGEDGKEPDYPTPDRHAAPKRLLETSRAGKAGEIGANGGDGKTGGKGGKIQIYCNNLIRFAPVELTAKGGPGGRGADAQQGGQGGHALGGYKTKEDAAVARGGPGGCGGNGGDGGPGGKGGEIHFCFVNRDEDQKGERKVTICITGGAGGDGGQPGKGGQGGDGGTPVVHGIGGLPARYFDGADSGGGGIGGLPGYGGAVGQWGTLEFCDMPWPFLGPAPASVRLWVQTILRDRATYSLPMPGNDGKPLDQKDEYASAGKPGKAAEPDPYRVPQQNEIPPSHGSDGQKGQPNKARHPKGPRAAAGSELDADDALGWWRSELTHRDLAAEADAEHLRMLFDHLRTRYLLTNLQTNSDSIAQLLEELQWLVSLAEAKKENELMDSATAIFSRLRLGCNIFGKDAQFAVLGAPEEYNGALTKMLDLYAPVEKAYEKLSGATTKAFEQHSYLENLKLSQDGVIGKLEELEKQGVQDLKATLAEIATLEFSQENLEKTVLELCGGLEGDIEEAVGLTPTDFFSLFNQLSFTNREFHDKAGEFLFGGAAAAGAMVLSQVGDMAVKAMENVATDTGGSVNKKYVIRRMQFLAKNINDMGGLKEARNGLLKADPNAEYRLLATREQFESILSNFYTKYPKAKQISHALDAFIEAVTARNQKVEEYNQLLSDLFNLRGELAKSRTHRNQTTATLLGNAHPGLPELARFGRALRLHAWEQCVEQLYMASRVYTLQSLDPYDVFADVLGKLGNAEQGNLDKSALNTALIDLISNSLKAKQKLRTNRETFVPQGQHSSRTLTPQKDPLLFLMLKAHKPGKFQMMPARRETTIDRNPFAGMADVRLSHIRCTVEGMKTSDGIQVIEIRHPGFETLVREDGREFQLHHNDVLHQCSRNTKTGLVVNNGALDKDHNMIGPFCEWEITIPTEYNSKLELDEIQSITVDFEGTFRGFVGQK
jgi:hypothetical protein